VARRGVIRFPGESVGNESEYSRQQNSLWRVVANSSAMHNADCSATLVLLESISDPLSLDPREDYWRTVERFTLHI